MANILVTGANGQLGFELQQLAARFPQHQFQFCSRTELDVTNAENVQKVFETFAPAYCINCAAYTAVDKAETEADAAFAGNATAPETLALACKQHGALFIHISTDYVFDGAATAPQTEESPTNPVNQYGLSKMQGEQKVMAANADAIIIRTSWVYSSHGANFVKTMMRLMQSRPEVRVVADQMGSPTYAADLAAAIMQIIESGKWQGGIYHYRNEGIISWADLAEAIKEILKSDCNVVPIPTTEYPTPARRPMYTAMDISKIKAVYGITPPHWKESLQKCMTLLQATA
ncbi:MAG: dTDP-4-dehydrorhamnose reductase [Chitinophagaceae bacterium]